MAAVAGGGPPPPAQAAAAEEVPGSQAPGATAGIGNMPPPCVIVKEVNASKNLRDIGDEAVWSLSTAKPGNGVEELRDGNLETYWQSDGGQPHMINIQFQRKMTISELAFYLDYGNDESYTPKKLEIKHGTTFHDLVQVRTVELHEPTGWVVIPLLAEDVLRTFFLQICVVAMHQNGRDTHVRQVKVFGPRTPIDKATDFTGLGFRPGSSLATFAVLR